MTRAAAWRRGQARGQRSSYLLPLILIVLPALILLPGLGRFPFQPGAGFSDLLVSHYPNGLYLQQSIREWGVIPLWSPRILGGYPFAANPLAGLFYPPGWLALLLPLPEGFNLLVIAHLAWGGWGLYHLLRRAGLAQPAALLGGLAFAAMPKLYAHLAAGHLTLLYAVPWTPWLLLAAHRSRKPADRLLPGAVLGLIVLADVRWAAYAGLLWLGYALVREEARTANEVGGAGRARALLRTAFSSLWTGVLPSLLFAGLCAAVLLLPLAEYTGLSTRADMVVDDALILSLPPARLLGFIYPQWGGGAEWTLYPGAVMMALAVYTLARPAARRRTGFWWLVFVLALLFSLGAAVPGMEGLFRLPGFNLLRVPPRALFLAGLSLAVIAAHGLNSLIQPGQNAPAGTDRARLVLFGAAVFVILLAAVVIVLTGLPQIQARFAWGALFFSLGAVWISLGQRGKVRPDVLASLLTAFALVDLSGVNALSIEFRGRQAVFGPSEAAADYIQSAARADTAAQGVTLPAGGPFRVYSPSYSLPQHTAAAYRLELADGVDPLQLAAYADFMQAASGVPAQGYSVTLPPFATGDPAVDNQEAVPDASQLGLLNVAFVAAEYDLPNPDLPLLARFGDTRVYANPLVLPRAWVQDPGAPLGEGIRSRPLINTQPNRVTLLAQGPGLLVLSENAYPGWTARVDGRPVPVETAAGLLRGVMLDEGHHQVEFAFRPASVYAGLALSALGWLILGTAWLRRAVRASAAKQVSG